MSRSQPEERNPNPSKRWYDWNAKHGAVTYYDKSVIENKGIITAPLPFTFMVLDILAVIKGWHDKSDSGITSNEVRDTVKDPMLVRAFKGGTIAEGFYSQIKDTVIANGGFYANSIYIAFKDGNEFKIGNIHFKGASLNVWIEFKKANEANLYTKAITITGSIQGKKGATVFNTPVFALKDINSSTEEIATELDKELQTYLTGYFSKTKVADQVHSQEVPERTGGIPKDVEIFTESIAEAKQQDDFGSNTATGLSQQELDNLPF